MPNCGNLNYAICVNKKNVECDNLKNLDHCQTEEFYKLITKASKHKEDKKVYEYISQALREYIIIVKINTKIMNAPFNW